MLAKYQDINYYQMSLYQLFLYTTNSSVRYEATKSPRYQDKSQIIIKCQITIICVYDQFVTFLYSKLLSDVEIPTIEISNKIIIYETQSQIINYEISSHKLFTIPNHQLFVVKKI